MGYKPVINGSDTGRKKIYLPFPLAATRSFVALRVWNSRCYPVTIFLVIPLFGLLGIWWRV
jgi:hypothetical protein